MPDVWLFPYRMIILLSANYNGTSNSLLRTQYKKLYNKDKISCPKLYYCLLMYTGNLNL